MIESTRLSLTRRVRLALVIAAILAAPVSTRAQDDGATLYKRHCATCHDPGVNRAPQPDALRAMPAERVLATMETGTMISMVTNRTAPERRAIAEFVTGKSLSTPFVTTPAAAAMCQPAATFDASSGPRWNGWGAFSGKPG